MLGMMTGRERILAALNRRSPDVVPHMELLIHERTIHGILPGATYEDFVTHMGNDGIVVHEKVAATHYEVIDASKRVKRNEWGGIVRFTDEDIGIPVGTAFATLDEVDLRGY